MKDQETMAQQALEEEARRHHEAYSKLERERSTEIELLHTRWALLCSPCSGVAAPFHRAFCPPTPSPRVPGTGTALPISRRESLVSLKFYLRYRNTGTCPLESM